MKQGTKDWLWIITQILLYLGGFLAALYGIGYIMRNMI